MLYKKIRSVGYALQGIKIALYEEHNFRFEIICALLTIAAGLYFKISTTHWMILLFVIGLVLTAELFNTALEELCDMLRETHDPHVAKIKDVAAAAVFVTTLFAACIGLLIFFPYVVRLAAFA